MDRRKAFIVVAILLAFVSMEAATVLAQGKGNDDGKGKGNGKGDDKAVSKGDDKGSKGDDKGDDKVSKGDDKGDDKVSKGDDKGDDKGSNGDDRNGGNGKGDDKENNGKGKGDDKKDKADDAAANKYDKKDPVPGTGQERGHCKSKGSCFNTTLTCPSQCPERKPKKNKKNKGCFINCGSKCEATCKYRKPKCDGYGSLCYDPRFVGGDGVMFYFHGAKGSDFAIVSDNNLQINAHFIGTRPAGRTRDYTWVQALSIMFDSHTLVLAAKRVVQWDDKVESLAVRWDGEEISIPTDGEAEWRINSEQREVVVERTDDTNTVKVTVSGLVEMDVKVTPIGEKENKVHNYQLPSDDAFAHLETQFKFSNLSDLVEGILGKTFRPGYVSQVKRGVPMPLMGGEDKYQTPSLYSPVCNVCRFQRQSSVATM